MCFALVFGQPATGQFAIGDDRAELVLGSVQVDKYTIKFLIACGGDSALLEFSVTDGKGSERYVPMFGSTYRGIPPVDLDVYVSKFKEELWVLSSWPGSEVLAYHRLGTQTAITPYGEKQLVDSSFPPVLSGGPVPFPTIDQDEVVKKASFYHRKELCR